VLCRAAQKTRLGRSVFCRCHGAGTPTRLQSPRRKGCIPTQRLHSAPQTDMSATTESTSRRHALFMQLTQTRNLGSMLADPDSWFVTGVAWVRFSTHSNLGFQCICFNVSTKMLREKNTRSYDRFFFSYLPQVITLQSPSNWPLRNQSI
jgi:hypothetical protein